MASATRPNFLFFLPDQHRFDWVPWNQDLPIRMPNLAEIAARGVRFNNALCPSPVCAPSRACLASGREYERCGVANNKFNYPLDQPTYYQSLRDAGYRVAGVGKFDLHKATLDWGLDGQRLINEWGFTEGIDNEGKMDALQSWVRNDGPSGPYMNFLKQRSWAETHVADFKGRRGAHGHHLAHATPLPAEGYCDNWIAENGLRFLEAFPKDQPWHLVVNFTGPHSPMDVTPDMKARWRDTRFPDPVPASPGENQRLGEAAAGEIDHQGARQNYAAMVENIDAQMGRFIDLVRRRGELENTIIVYSSDHGEMLGDHDRWGKSIYYQPSAGVPLVVAGPGVRSGASSDALVSMHDVTATFLDLAGLPALPGMDSKSLVPLLTGQTDTHRPHVRSGLDSWRLVFDGRYKLVRDITEDGTSSLLLFDLAEDPSELQDLAAARPAEVTRLTPLLEPPA